MAQKNKDASPQFQTDSEWQAQRKKRKRAVKRRRRIIRIACVLVLLAVAAAVCVRVFFVAKNINVINDTPYSSEELLDAVGFSVGSSLLSINSSSVMQKLSDYPYVEEATVKISFPSDITFTFVSAVAVYSFDLGGSYAYLDKNLKVLQISDQDDPSLISVSGIVPQDYSPGDVLDNSNALELDIFSELVAVLSDMGWAEHVTSLDFTKTYNIRITVYDIITVELGTGEDLDKKLTNAKTVYKLNDPSRPAIINAKDYLKCRYSAVQPQSGT